MIVSNRAIIITGSGRSGTYNIHQFINQYAKFKGYHELDFEKMLKLGVLKYEGYIDLNYREKTLSQYFNSLLKHGKTGADVSNAALWCVEDLRGYSEYCEFYMVIRNGYKVVASFYNKFKDLMYPDHQILPAFRAFKDRNFDHKLDKTFWRPLPREKNFYQKYEDNLRFAVICWYWRETIRQYEVNSSHFKKMFRFEDIISGKDLSVFAEMLNLKLSRDMPQFFATPTNIENRTNFKLDKTQMKIFEEICGEYMKKYYSNSEYYDVEY